MLIAEICRHPQRQEVCSLADAMACVWQRKVAKTWGEMVSAPGP